MAHHNLHSDRASLTEALDGQEEHTTTSSKETGILHLENPDTQEPAECDKDSGCQCKESGCQCKDCVNQRRTGHEINANTTTYSGKSADKPVLHHTALGSNFLHGSLNRNAGQSSVATTNSLAPFADNSLHEMGSYNKVPDYLKSMHTDPHVDLKIDYQELDMFARSDTKSVAETKPDYLYFAAGPLFEESLSEEPLFEEPVSEEPMCWEPLPWRHLSEEFSFGENFVETFSEEYQTTLAASHMPQGPREAWSPSRDYKELPTHRWMSEEIWDDSEKSGVREETTHNAAGKSTHNAQPIMSTNPAFPQLTPKTHVDRKAHALSPTASSLKQPWRPRRSPIIRNEDWSLHREKIVEFYIKCDMTLREVMDRMRFEFDFTAS
jgi:hypothetical protein